MEIQKQRGCLAGTSSNPFQCGGLLKKERQSVSCGVVQKRHCQQPWKWSPNVDTHSSPSVTEITPQTQLQSEEDALVTAVPLSIVRMGGRQVHGRRHGRKWQSETKDRGSSHQTLTLISHQTPTQSAHKAVSRVNKVQQLQRCHRHGRRQLCFPLNSPVKLRHRRRLPHEFR